MLRTSNRPGGVFLLLLLLTFLFPGTARAQRMPEARWQLSIDSLPRYMEGNIWRFSTADLSNGADTDLADSTWPLINASLMMSGNSPAHGFRGIGWLRLHFYTDSSFEHKPLALRIAQTGASEIYLDGRLLYRYGKLLPRDSARYRNPQNLPLALPAIKPGPHVIAVRYANWEYLRNKERYGKEEAGFRIGQACNRHVQNPAVGTFIRHCSAVRDIHHPFAGAPHPLPVLQRGAG